MNTPNIRGRGSKSRDYIRRGPNEDVTTKLGYLLSHFASANRDLASLTTMAQGVKTKVELARQNSSAESPCATQLDEIEQIANAMIALLVGEEGIQATLGKGSTHATNVLIAFTTTIARQLDEVAAKLVTLETRTPQDPRPQNHR